MIERLSDFKRINAEIESLSDEIAYYERHRSIRVADRIAEIKEQLNRLMDEKIIVSRIIDKLSDPSARTVYRLRYIVGEKWSAVAAKCGKMSERSAHYIHEQSLPEFERLYAEALAERSGE